MPDFDIDFCYIRRPEVIKYVIEKYGADHVAQIITFGTLAAKAAVKDIGRAMAIPYSVVDSVSKLIPNDIHQTIDNALLQSDQLKKLYNSDVKIKELLDLAKEVEGMPRHASTHAAGVVITDKPVEEYVPLALNDNSAITQFTMTELEQIGLLKMDFLGLRNLTVIDDTVRMIKEFEAEFDINKIDINDQKVYKMLSKGLSLGVFQFESAGMRKTMTQLKPSDLEDLIALLSLYRPGPVKSIPKYIENKHNPNKISYSSPLLEPILNVTYGCIVYQEQVMQIFRTLANYTLGKADIIRRAMAKKKHDVLAKERVNFINGCKDNGINENIANNLFDEISSFSSYAFNKAHAAAYSLVSYRTAYLKCYYPSQYMAALITSVLDRANKVQEYFEECKRLSIKILPPDINRSNYNFAEDDGNIRYGLLAIKGVGRVLVNNLIAERKENGDFVDFYDFCKRCSSRDLNRRSVEALIKAGCFDNFKYNRREMLENLDNILSNIQRKQSSNVDGQIDFFESSSNDVDISIKKYDEFDKSVLQKQEKEVIGFYLSGHPLEKYNEISFKNKFDRISDILNNDERYFDNKQVRVLVNFESIKKKTTKSGDVMAFCDISDTTSNCELIVFPKIYSAYSSYIMYDKPFVLSGRVSIKDDAPKQIICEQIEFIDDYYNLQTLYIKVKSLNDIAFKNALDLLSKNKGSSPVFVHCEDTKKTLKADKYNCKLTNDLFYELKKILGENNVAKK